VVMTGLQHTQVLQAQEGSEAATAARRRSPPLAVRRGALRSPVMLPRMIYARVSCERLHTSTAPHE